MVTLVDVQLDVLNMIIFYQLKPWLKSHFGLLWCKEYFYIIDEVEKPLEDEAATPAYLAGLQEDDIIKVNDVKPLITSGLKIMMLRTYFN